MTILDISTIFTVFYFIDPLFLFWFVVFPFLAYFGVSLLYFF